MNRDLESVHCGRSFSIENFSAADVQTALLGKEPHYAPSRDFRALHIALDLSIDFRRREVDAVCRLRVRSFREQLSSLIFDAAEMKISGVQVNGKRAAFAHKDSKLKVRLARPLQARQEAEVEVHYRLVRPQAGLHFVPSYPPNSVARQVWSQGQPEDSRYWFPCHDAPHEKATSEIRATVPDGFMAVSNGRLVDTRRDPKKRVVTYHWRMNQPHALYLITLAAGRFGVAKDKWRDVPVEFYCEKGREGDAKRSLAKTSKAIDFFSTSLGVDYPYDKYAQVMVAEFPGGMENTTATTMTEACLIDAKTALDNDVDLLMAHELAHQWFGDLVTCRDWAHAWLNEGFATYFECLFTRHDKGQDEFDYELYRNQQDYFQEDRDRYRRPIVSRYFRNPWVLFDRHLYQKAAAVLHMLRRELGDEEWWKSMGHYLKEHSHQSVETKDLIISIEQATGRNLRPFFDRWIFQTGYPHLRARCLWKQRGRRLEVHVMQTQRISDDSPVFKLPLDIRIEGRGFVKDFTEFLDGKEHRWQFDLPGEPLNVEIDPDHWLLKRIDMHKPLRMWEHQLSHAPRAMSRIYAAQAMTHWPGESTVRVLARALQKERFWGAASEMAQAIGSIRTQAGFKSLTGFARHKEPKVRRSVIQALGWYKRPEAAALLRSVLQQDPSVNVQAEAARALGALGDAKLLPLLRSKLSKISYWDTVKGGALSAIANLKDKRALNIFRKFSLPGGSYPARVYAVRALADFAQVSDQVVPWLCELLEDLDGRVSMPAAGSLGRLEDERALPALEKVLKTTPNLRLKTAITEAITRIRAGSEAAVKSKH